MPVAFDASSTLALGTGDRSFTHTPTGTPRGVIVIVVDGVGTDQVVGVTYGASTMTQVALSPLLKSTGETGSVHGFFLGSSVPTGAQTVSIDRADTTDYIAACCTVTADDDTAVEDTSTLSSGAIANPGVTLTIATASFCMGGLYSGVAAPTSIAPGADTADLVEGDLGTDSCSITRGTTIPASDFAYTWTVASDDAAVLAVAVKESAAAPASTDSNQPPMGSLALLGVGR